jgi:SAM-dependent methyltransferase
MLDKLKKIYQKEQFIPTWLSIFINPLYFLRKSLYKKIYKHRNFMCGNLLDFGCGSKPYEGIFEVQKYTGLDIESSVHDHKNENIDVFYDGKKIPFKDEYFDSIFSSEVLEHIFNIDEILKELNRVLKKDGHILITLPFIWNEHEEPYDFSRYTSFGIVFLLKNHGFKVVACEKTNNFIEALFQMKCIYLHLYFFPKNKYINFILTVLLIGPVNLLGLIISSIFPRDYSFYNNDVILAKKVK